MSTFKIMVTALRLCFVLLVSVAFTNVAPFIQRIDQRGYALFWICSSLLIHSLFGLFIFCFYSLFLNVSVVPKEIVLEHEKARKSDTCQPGEYINEAACSLCPVGYYSSTYDATECTLAPKGNSLKSTRTKTIKILSPLSAPWLLRWTGYYVSESGASTPTRCTFSISYGAAVCQDSKGPHTSIPLSQYNQ